MSRITPQCDNCLQHLKCVSDAPFGWGRITWEHEGPCIPPTVKPVLGYCSNPECERPVYGERPPGRRPRNLWCSDECRNLLAEERRLSVLAAGRRYQARLRRQERVA